MDSESLDISKKYVAKEVDAKWYSFWEKQGFFRADVTSSKPPYSIVIPPPNVTGVLHMGHALVNTLQDILIRWKRMSGYEALWVPGTDHAGIATQGVVERHLQKSEGKRRDDYSREEFVKLVWEWKETHEQKILGQLKKLGCSCDWSRLRFTMDKGCSQGVRTLFKKLFDEGLIYRGDYLVNWDPLTQTALADDEVEYEERNTFLWYFKYPLVDDGGFVHIATTRPETMLGDTAIAVSPKDKRYAHLVGKKVRLPILDREIPIIADYHFDPEFGTGAVKVTPAHDPNDYRMGLDHNLPFINVLTPSGEINENGGPFQGMPREIAREEVVKHMHAMGLVEKITRYTHRVGVSYRSKAIIEPYLSKQWFVKMTPFVEPLKKAVTEGNVTIRPKSWEHTYFHWVDNLRDWCISRQLWWGHRIPVWYHREDPDRVICFDGDGVPPEVEAEPEMWQQDEELLDTWFSSALWPMTTLGWPEKTEELKRFYPTSVLVTGHDILFFWVARMICIDHYVSGQYPFPETFLHGLIFGKSYWTKSKEGNISYITGKEKREFELGKEPPKGVYSKWEKLSKSTGNVIDPLEMIEEYGTDAVRMSLCACANQSPQIDLDRRRFEEFKNFANKVWNGARFVLMNLEDLDSQQLSQGLEESLLSLEDRWILSALNRVNLQINQALENYAFDEAALASYDFFWKEFCAYYLEITKPVLFGKEGTAEERKNKQKLLVIVLVNALRLMHPMTPFITEEIFQKLKSHFSEVKKDPKADLYTRATVDALLCSACIVAPYPKEIRPSDRKPEIEETFALMEKVVYTIRNIRGEMKIPPALATDLYLMGANKAVEENLKIIRALVKVDKIHLVNQPPKLPFSATGAIGQLKLLIPLPQELADKEKVRLEKERERLSKQCNHLRAQLANQDFLAKAHPSFVEKQRNSLLAFEEELKVILSKLST